MATTRTPRDFKEFLKSLDRHSARFLPIGGYAVSAFGYVRNTVDMDVWIAADTDNQQKVLQAIRDFAFPDVRDDLLNEDDTMVRMGQPSLRIWTKYLEEMAGLGNSGSKRLVRWLPSVSAYRGGNSGLRSAGTC